MIKMGVNIYFVSLLAIGIIWMYVFGAILLYKNHLKMFNLELENQRLNEENKKTITKIRDELYELLPSGDVNAFDLILLIKNYIQKLDDLAQCL